MMSDKKHYLTLTLLVILLITAFLQNKSLREKLDDTNTRLQVLENALYTQISGIRQSIPEQIKNILNDQSNRISHYEFTIRSINHDERNAELSLDFTLKNVNGNSDVFVIYKAKDDNNENNSWEEMQAEKTGTLSYSVNLNLSLKENYTFRFVEKAKDGSTSELNVSPVTKNLYSEFYENRTLLTSSGRSESKDMLEFNFSIENNTFGLDEFKIKSVECKLYYKDVLFYNEDITLLNLGNPEDIARYNLQVASGQIEPYKEMRSIGEVASRDENIEKMYFRITLNKEDLIRDHLDLFSDRNGFFKGEMYKYELIIKYNSGETMVI